MEAALAVLGVIITVGGLLYSIFMNIAQHRENKRQRDVIATLPATIVEGLSRSMAHNNKEIVASVQRSIEGADVSQQTKKKMYSELRFKCPESGCNGVAQPIQPKAGFPGIWLWDCGKGHIWEAPG